MARKSSTSLIFFNSGTNLLNSRLHAGQDWVKIHYILQLQLLTYEQIGAISIQVITKHKDNYVLCRNMNDHSNYKKTMPQFMVKNSFKSYVLLNITLEADIYNYSEVY